MTVALEIHQLCPIDIELSARHEDGSATLNYYVSCFELEMTWQKLAEREFWSDGWHEKRNQTNLSMLPTEVDSQRHHRWTLINRCWGDLQKRSRRPSFGYYYDCYYGGWGVNQWLDDGWLIFRSLNGLYLQTYGPKKGDSNWSVAIQWEEDPRLECRQSDQETISWQLFIRRQWSPLWSWCNWN